MKTIFSRRFPTSLRLLIFIIISIVLILSTDRMTSTRVFLISVLSPLQFIANAPSDALDSVSANLKSRRTLIDENETLRRFKLSVSDRLLTVEHLEQENKRLRALLGSPVGISQRKLIARVQAVDSNPFSLQVTINKGLNDQVYVGQPVVDEDGVVGQVIEVGKFTSRILLIADNSHAIPLRNQRNDVRLIGLGKGDLHQLELQYVTKNTDVKIGDLLVTSGLGGLYPEGYPVAKVSAIENRGSEIYSLIRVEPIAKLDRLRYLLLLWPKQTTKSLAVKQAIDETPNNGVKVD
ncbi:MAG: rod shape-determining protein MreC [Psychrobium sp.]|nr:rod shape-determining protein MreC [Psychrobium sp.]